MSTKYQIQTDKGTYEIEVDDAQQEQSAPQEMSFGQKMQVAGASAKAAWDLTPMAHPVDNLPMDGAMIGSAVAPGLGTAAGAGIGQIAKRMVEVGQGDTALAGKNIAPREAIAPMAQTAVAGLPEVDGVKKAVQAMAQKWAVRGVGIKPGVRKAMGTDKVMQVGQTMLDAQPELGGKSVIQPFSGSEATLGRAEDLAKKTGEAIGSGMDALDEAGAKSFNPRDVAKKVYGELKPDYRGGAYNQQENIAREIHNTIMAHARGSDAGTFNSAQALKETLQDLGKFNSNTDQMKAQMYRKASGMVKQALEDSVDAAAGSQVIDPNLSPSMTDLTAPGEKVVGQVSTIDPSIYPEYLRNKKVYGAAETAAEGLRGKVDAENFSPTLSPRGTIIAAGALASGHLTPALEAVGAYELGSRIGARTGAATLNFVNNSAVAENVRRAVMSEFISRITTKGGSQ